MYLISSKVYCPKPKPILLSSVHFRRIRLMNLSSILNSFSTSSGCKWPSSYSSRMSLFKISSVFWTYFDYLLDSVSDNLLLSYKFVINLLASDSSLLPNFDDLLFLKLFLESNVRGDLSRADFIGFSFVFVFDDYFFDTVRL